MKVVLIPETKNEELINRARALLATFNSENFGDEEFDHVRDKLDELEAKYGRDDMLDALYYASSQRKEMLEEQARYFYDCLCHDEYSYYESRMLFGDASIQRE